MSEQEQTLVPEPAPEPEPVPVVEPEPEPEPEPAPEPVAEEVADNQEDDINISNPVDNEPNSENSKENSEEDSEDSNNSRGGLSSDQIVQLISDNINGNYMDKINSLTGQLTSHQAMLQSHADQLRRFTQTGRAFYGTAHQIINGNM